MGWLKCLKHRTEYHPFSSPSNGRGGLAENVGRQPRVVSLCTAQASRNRIAREGCSYVRLTKQGIHFTLFLGSHQVDRFELFV